MKSYYVLALLLTSCGYSSMNNEVIGQVKKVVKNTPIICPNYSDIDLSLGVIRNGVGSMSSEDKWMYVPNSEDLALLKQANESGALVKIQYNQKRLTFCVDEVQVSHVELVK